MLWDRKSMIRSIANLFSGFCSCPATGCPHCSTLPYSAGVSLSGADARWFGMRKNISACVLRVGIHLFKCKGRSILGSCPVRRDSGLSDEEWEFFSFLPGSRTGNFFAASRLIQVPPALSAVADSSVGSSSNQPQNAAVHC